LADCPANSSSDWGAEKQFIRIANHALPAEIPHAIHNFPRDYGILAQIRSSKQAKEDFVDDWAIPDIPAFI
jgi:hypothetical protein